MCIFCCRGCIDLSLSKCRSGACTMLMRQQAILLHVHIMFGFPHLHLIVCSSAPKTMMGCAGCCKLDPPIAEQCAHGPRCAVPMNDLS